MRPFPRPTCEATAELSPAGERSEPAAAWRRRRRGRTDQTKAPMTPLALTTFGLGGWGRSAEGPRSNPGRSAAETTLGLLREQIDPPPRARSPPTCEGAGALCVSVFAAGPERRVGARGVIGALYPVLRFGFGAMNVNSYSTRHSTTPPHWQRMSRMQISGSFHTRQPDPWPSGSLGGFTLSI